MSRRERWLAVLAYVALVVATSFALTLALREQSQLKAEICARHAEERKRTARMFGVLAREAAGDPNLLRFAATLRHAQTASAIVTRGCPR